MGPILLCFKKFIM